MLLRDSTGGIFPIRRRHSTMEAIHQGGADSPGAGVIVSRRMSRFRPVRFQEYRMRWGCTAASVCDLHVLVPEKRVEGFREDTSQFAHYRLPSDSELVQARAEVSAGALGGCAHQGCCAVQLHRSEWRQVSGLCGHVDRCPHSGCRRGSLVAGRQQWPASCDQSPSGVTDQELTIRRSQSYRPVGPASSFDDVDRSPFLSPPSLAPPPCTPEELLLLAAPLSATVQLVAAKSRFDFSINPQLMEVKEATSTDTSSSVLTLASVSSYCASLDPPASAAGATATAAAASMPPLGLCTVDAVPDVFVSQSGVERRVASVVGQLQDALLAAVRAETEPLERRLMEREAQLRQLQLELEAKDARLRHLTALLSCRQCRDVVENDGAV